MEQRLPPTPPATPASFPTPPASPGAAGEGELQPTEAWVPWHLDRIDQRTLPLDGQFGATATGRGVNVYIISSVSGGHAALCCSAPCCAALCVVGRPPWMVCQPGRYRASRWACCVAASPPCLAALLSRGCWEHTKSSGTPMGPRDPGSNLPGAGWGWTLMRTAPMLLSCESAPRH